MFLEDRLKNNSIWAAVLTETTPYNTQQDKMAETRKLPKRGLTLTEMWSHSNSKKKKDVPGDLCSIIKGIDNVAIFFHQVMANIIYITFPNAIVL